jgi:FMN phosphatase YigB (HAD superfamily)/DNA-binding XRE family transcriptional regulator
MTGVDKNQEKALAKAIAKARKKAGFTQQDLCNKAGLSYSTLAKIERGAIKTPSVFTVATIASVTGTTVEALTGIGNVKPNISPALPKKHYKTSKNGVKFIYFDINGVLVRFFQRAFTQISAVTGASPDGIEATFWHYNDALCKGDMTLDQFNQILAKRIGIGNINWQDYYLNNIDPISEMHECIKWVSEHYHIGLLSNIMPGFIPQMIAKNLVPNINYDVIVDSSQIGTIKPEPEIYQYAQQEAKVNSNEILLIDDSRPNLMAAEKLGWHVLWFDDYRPDEGATRVRDALAY